MRDLTDQEILTIAGANGDNILSPGEAGGIMGATIGSRYGKPGAALGGMIGTAIGNASERFANQQSTLQPLIINLPMNGTPSNHQYGGGFS